jgi:enoyl-CoA hydratase
MILCTVSDHIATVTMARPEARNALTLEMIRDLRQRLRELDADPDVRVIILTGADPAFCAGLDLKDLPAIFDGLQLSGEGDGHGLLVQLSTPLIGAVNGAAVGGGLEIALGCDFLIASHRARFADTHATVGLLPGGGITMRLTQLVGINRARQMSFSADFVDAGEACEWGLVNEVVPHDGLLTRTNEIATMIAAKNPVMISAYRDMYDTLGLRHDPEAYVEEARRSREWRRDHVDGEALGHHARGLVEKP